MKKIQNTCDTRTNRPGKKQIVIMNSFERLCILSDVIRSNNRSSTKKGHFHLLGPSPFAIRSPSSIDLHIKVLYIFHLTLHIIKI